MMDLLEKQTSNWRDTLDAIFDHRLAYAGNTGTKDSAIWLLEAIASGTESYSRLVHVRSLAAPCTSRMGCLSKVCNQHQSVRKLATRLKTE